MKAVFGLLFLFFLTTFCHATPLQGKKIVVVLAHPDDETAMMQVLYKWAKTNTVYLIVATDGRLGARFGNKPGDTLAAIREKETECGCKKLGIQPPIFFKFHEDLGILKSIGEYHKQSELLAEKVKQNIIELNPDVIITFGPDGDTGHYMHRQISNTVTEVILKEGWVKRYPLYYLAWLQKDSDKLKASIGLGLNTVHPEYYNLQIKFNQQEEDASLPALECYTSQLSADEVKGWKVMEQNDRSNTLHFRRLEVSKKKKTGL
jgi:LmbE family N-acetylglucosaminyl deacetylase